MTVIVDYGVGNLFSLESSLKFIGEEVTVSGTPEIISQADRLILPGVGAFRDAARNLEQSGLKKQIIEFARREKPLLGVCLGMQLLFERSFEFGETPGLGLLSGEIKPIEPMVPKGYKVPHIGWNPLNFSKNDGKALLLLKHISEGDCVYFVHSYAANGCNDSLIATAEYGAELTAAVAKGNIFGTQFHPEKSGTVGLNILKAFCKLS